MNWSRFVVLAALALSGCFRPAGDSIEPTSNNPTSEQVVQPLDQATPTTGIPPVTLLSADTPVATSTEPLPVITEITLAPATQTYTPTEPGQASDDTSATPTLQIITPGFSINLITPDTPTPLPMETLEANSGINMGATEDLSGSVDNSGNPEETLVSGADCTYTVESGDSLYRIAVLNDVTVDDMKAANSDLVGDAPILQPGQVVKIPFCVPGQGTMTPLPSSEAGSGPTETPAPAASQEIYTVRSGDTLGAIATRFGVTVNAIMRANNLDNANRLSIGQSLIIPAKAP
ncbi:MAG: LysM peptidoglycan-binding domain-containing protein [Chloroflexi bacterium]|nr:LysM peptidoglycan-binding domain-containing protein [Chloroflexota bacterium]